MDDIKNTNTEEEFDNQTEIENYGQHIFKFVGAPLYVALFSGRSMELLYFVVSDGERSGRQTVKRML